MKKNLIYYTVSIKDEYSELLKKSIESVDISNEDYIDIVILTDVEYFEKNLTTIKRPNTTIFLIEKPKNFDEACFSKLKIWDYPNIDQYENILYLDSDVLVNKNLKSIFDKCNDENKLYVVVEDYNISNHNRIHFSLESYKNEDLDFFKKNEIYTFNAGTFMFKNGLLMKKHFRNVMNLILQHEGPFFTDQSFMNYYFNTYKLTDYKAIVKDVDYKFVVNSNFSDEFDTSNCIMHFLTEGDNKNNTIERMNILLSKMKTKTDYYDRFDWFNNVSKTISGGKGVEIGVYKGDFSKFILQYWNGTLYMVDVWRKQGPEYDDLGNYANHNVIYNQCVENTKDFEDRAIMIRASSRKASEIFADDSLDFVYIDANHAYEYVKEDIDLWFPKLKKGGIFSGHDYLNMDWYADPNFASNMKDKYIYNSDNEYLGLFGVNPAVDEFCKENGYKLYHTGEWYSTWWIIK